MEIEPTHKKCDLHKIKITAGTAASVTANAIKWKYYSFIFAKFQFKESKLKTRLFLLSESVETENVAHKVVP